MDKYEQFKKHITESAEKFKKIDKKETIRLISHLDADGIAAASLIIRLLNKDNRSYSISIVTQLNKEVITALSKESYKCFIFTDLGSGQLNAIEEILGDRKIVILDHHQPEKTDIKDNIIHVNPHLFGIDGSNEISGAGVVYYFASAVDESMKELAHVPIIGAIGDIQEEHGFAKLNKDILEEAIKRDKIKVIKGLRVFGAQTRPLHKVLEYCTNPFIPGVSGSESGAIQFLHQIGIEPRDVKGWRKIVHLSDEELKKLAAAIIMKRVDEEKPEEIIGDVYILPNEAKESPTRDAKEFATLLNACGRLSKASLGIGACLGDKKIKEKAIRSMMDYKKEIVNALNWYERSKESEQVIKGKGYMIINARDNILPTIVGTMASIISKSNSIEPGTLILSMADLLDGNTKASLRVAGLKQDVDLYNIIKEISGRVAGSEAGGHMYAAGAMLSTEKEIEFIQAAKDILEKKAMEEKIV
ncbi:MAG: DHH family phosphoesterase [Nanoarchaeota archaeon]